MNNPRVSNMITLYINWPTKKDIRNYKILIIIFIKIILLLWRIIQSQYFLNIIFYFNPQLALKLSISLATQNLMYVRNSHNRFLVTTCNELILCRARSSLKQSNAIAAYVRSNVSSDCIRLFWTRTSNFHFPQPMKGDIRCEEREREKERERERERKRERERERERERTKY